MRHGKIHRKFGRVKKVRTALTRSLLRSLIMHESIETTQARAKEIRPMIEKLVSRGRTDSVSNRRIVTARLGSAPRETKKLFTALSPRFKDRKGGYTRITKLSPDASGARARIEFVE